MIPVAMAVEPPDFDARVRRPGLSAIRELAGRRPLLRRSAHKRAAICGRYRDIPSVKYPEFWRDALPDVAAAYGRICAYSCLYIHSATGEPTIGHRLPKSMAWHGVYRWSNYRLACSLMNSRKGADERVLDPFRVEDGWFAMEFTAYQVAPGPAATGDVLTEVLYTIERLRLNDARCCDERRDYVQWYETGELTLRHLDAKAPFIARELRRNGRLLPDDR